MDREKKYLGTGVKFPPQVNPATGRFEMISGEESVRQSVYLILMTQKQERFIHPDFGSRLFDYTFTDGNQAQLNLLAADLARDIRRGEPRTDNVEVHVNPDIQEGCLMVYVEYTARESGNKDNLVFPFYLNE